MESKKLQELRREVNEKRANQTNDDTHNIDSNPTYTEPFKELEPISLGSDIKANDGFNLLGIILETAFFYSLFEYIAVRQFSSKTRQLRIARMRAIHPSVYRWSIRADFAIRVIVVLAIVGAGIYSVFKVLR